VSNHICQKTLNFAYAFKCYQNNVTGLTLAGPPCSRTLVLTGACRRPTIVVRVHVSPEPRVAAVYASFVVCLCTAGGYHRLIMTCTADLVAAGHALTVLMVVTGRCCCV